jgi:hemerythrin superfamily protein
MPNAVQMLKQDHKKVAGLFEKYGKTKGQETKRRIADQAMEQLEIHSKIEEEIFYPAAKEALGDDALISEALKEHAAVKDLIEELKSMETEDEEFDEKFTELIADVKHHVSEEESDLLPQAEESEMDLAALGGEMAERKQELIDENGGSEERPGGKSKRGPKHAENRQA